MSKMKKPSHHFKQIDAASAILPAQMSIKHRSLKGVVGQDSAVSVITLALAHLLKSLDQWSPTAVKSAVHLGTKHHVRSLVDCKNKNLTFLLPPHIYKYFFFDQFKLTMLIQAVNTLHTLHKESQPRDELKKMLYQFIAEEKSGVFYAQNKCYPIWYDETLKLYAMLNMYDHDENGAKYSGQVPGLGFAHVLAANSIDVLAERIFDSIQIKEKTNFHLYPCKVEKVVEIDTRPPETLANLGKPKGPSIIKEGGKVYGVVATLPKQKNKRSKELQPSAPPAEEVQQVEIKLKEPPLRPRVDSTTKFQAMGDGTGGILRSRHLQINANDFNPKLAQAMSLAALVLLRLHKAKTWTRKALDSIDELGQMIYKCELRMKNNFETKIPIENHVFQPVFLANPPIGVLQSTDPKILDLFDALQDTLIEFEACIIDAPPNIVLVWLEGAHFYMFDPQPRNANGEKVDKLAEGAACVTWFQHLKDLTRLYMWNYGKCEQGNRKFTLRKVRIDNYRELAADWYNFKALASNVWLLRGTFSQAHPKFGAVANTQCTAMAAMAIAWTQIEPEMQKWSAMLLDAVLMNGHELYIQSLMDLVARNRFKDKLLMIDEVRRHFHAPPNYTISFHIDDCVINGDLRAKDVDTVYNLKMGLQAYFEQFGASCVVTANKQTMAVWQSDTCFYYFDSHSRNERGLKCAHGTCCLLRMSSVEDLADFLLSNMLASERNLFNISRVGCTVTKESEDGVVLPLLNAYTALTDYVAILRSNLSTLSAKFGLNCGKQAVPMALMAFSYNSLMGSREWTQSDVDVVMEMGNGLYMATMEQLAARKELERGAEPTDVAPEMPVKTEVEGGGDGEEKQEEGEIEEEKVTSENVGTKWEIGKNRIEIEFAEDGTIEGNYEENLREAFEQLEADEEKKFEGLFESDLMQVCFWRDEHLFYLFDARPRTGLGQIYGKEEWPVVAKEEEEEENEEEEEGGRGGDEEEADERGGGDRNEDEDEEREERVEEDVAEEEEENEEIEEEEEKVVNSAWKLDEAQNGRACILRFSRLDDFIAHFMDNSPEPDRAQLQFRIKQINLINEPKIREIHQDATDADDLDPELRDDTVKLPQPWYNFTDIDIDKWILRSRMRMSDLLFPEPNRNKQQIACCVLCQFFVANYSLEAFTHFTLDDILRYGDRALTIVLRRIEKRIEKEGAGLSEESKDKLREEALNEVYIYGGTYDIFEHRAMYKNYKYAEQAGDVSIVREEDEAPPEDGVLNLTEGIEKFFASEEANKFGILVLRNYHTAIWKYQEHYFMFDPHNTAASGLASPIGVACIMRFEVAAHLAEIILQNVPQIGANFYRIDKFDLEISPHVPERAPQVCEISPEALSGFAPIMQGKGIVRGTEIQTCDKFQNGIHLQGCSIAFVALAMSLIKKAETWTKMIVNQVLTVGNAVHWQSLYSDKLKDKYNVWAHRWQLEQVVSDFDIGAIRVSHTVRQTVQRGRVDAKYPSNELNLRQGIERFFLENTHGILEIDYYFFAVWEERDDEKGVDWIYLFDPNSRGLTGLPGNGGVACLVKMCNAKMLFEHLMSLLASCEDKENLQFTIYPIELVVGDKCTRRKLRKMKKEDCEQGPTVEQKRILRQRAEEERRRTRMRQIGKFARDKFTDIGTKAAGVMMLRGTGELIDASRDIQTCVVAYVLLKLYKIEKMSHLAVDLILDIGNKTYMETVPIVGRKRNVKLGLDGVQRTFLFTKYKVHVSIFNPIDFRGFTSANLLRVMRHYFILHSTCLLTWRNLWITCNTTRGRYYVFYPYGVSANGVAVEQNGSACFFKFDDLDGLSAKIFENFQLNTKQLGGGDEFNLVPLALESYEKVADERQQL